MGIVQSILDHIYSVEDSHNIKVLYAVENGSRAWGMASGNSDYDIRFIYSRPLEDYISVSPKQDSIEFPVEVDNLDFVGFDILKFARLLANSNPTCLEGMVSDIYYKDSGLIDGFRRFAISEFDDRKLYYHYASMCKSNYMKYLHSKADVTYKKYLYALRGMVNAIYVRDIGQVPPIDLRAAAGRISVDGSLQPGLYTELIGMMDKKVEGLGKDIIQNIRMVDESVEGFIKSKPTMLKGKRGDIGLLDHAIRGILLEGEHGGIERT